LTVNIFGLYTEVNKENCGLEEQAQVVYMYSMVFLSKESFRSITNAILPIFHFILQFKGIYLLKCYNIFFTTFDRDIIYLANLLLRKKSNHKRQILK